MGVIDLENIQYMSFRPVATQLGGRPNTVYLTPEEESLIAEFNGRIHSIPYRFLVFSTQSLAGQVMDYKNSFKLANKIIKQLEKDGFTIMTTPQQLTEKILFDMLNFDIPYFTKRGDELYYGTIHEGSCIAKARK